MTRTSRALALVLIAAGYLAGAAPGPRAGRLGSELLPKSARPQAAGPGPGQIAAAPGFRLSEGEGAAEAPTLVARPAATRLTSDEARHVTDRLPALAAEPRVEPFALREPSLPPPRAGHTERTPFPPLETAARPETAVAGPLRVLRRQPEGDVPLAPHLSVTFSQPMVALDSVAALALRDVPLRLEPEAKGEWRWVGTRTLVFEPEGRFPMASEYRATVAAGAKSESGATLASSVSWSFRTPPPRLVARHPEGGPVRRDALLFAAFDQRIDPATVLASVRVRAGGALLTARLATPAEVEQDETVARLARAAEPGRWLAFRTEQPLPPDATVEVSVGPGTPSAEGPRKSETAERWSFRSYGPFRVRNSECGWNGRCTPFDPWRIELSNPIDAKTLDKEVVRVEPELPGLKLESWGNTLAVRGVAKGRTSYRVTLSSTLHDAFGQELEPGAPLTFAVGAAPATLQSQGGEFVVLDPAGGPALPVYSTGHASLRVEAYAVTPDDFTAWLRYRHNDWRKETARPPGRRVLDTTVRVAGELDALTETRIDLGQALTGGLGQLVVAVRPTTVSKDVRDQPVLVWVQSTRIGLDAFADGETLLAWANDLATGRALAGVELALGGVAGRTGQDGLVRLALGDVTAPLLVARRGADVAILPQQTSWWNEGGGWRKRPRVDALRFFVFDDRKLYRPGEDVRVKGWLRLIGKGPRGDVEPLPDSLRSLAWTLRDSQGNESAKGTTALGPAGGFDVTLKLAPTFNLGTASLLLEADAPGLDDRTHLHSFSVQEFRRPEFEVKAVASEGPYLTAGDATVTVSAAYYAGGALPGAEVTWNVAARTGYYRPPNRDGFSFGSYVPWWRPPSVARQNDRSETFTARTDGAGLHRLRIDFERQDPPRPRVITAEATVIDVNRQAWTAVASLLVHPSERYVGLRAERPFVQKGEPIVLEVIATDLDGRAVSGIPIRLRAERLEWEQVRGEWQEVAHDPETRELRAVAEPSRVRLATKEGGAYHVLATVADAQGRENETELRVWVAGGRVPPRRDLEQEEVTLVPDRQEYRPGDVAKLLVMAPFAPAEGVLTLRRAGLASRPALLDGLQLGDAQHSDRGGLHRQRARAGGPRGRGAARRSRILWRALDSPAAGVRQRRPRPRRAAPLPHARAFRGPPRVGARPWGRDRARALTQGRRRRASRERGGGGRGRGRGRPRAHRLPSARPARRLLRAAHPRRLGLPAPVARAARCPRVPRRRLRAAGGSSHARDHQRSGGAGRGADAEDGGPRDGRGQAGRRSDPRPHRFLGARALRRERAARRCGPGKRPRQASRQPHPLSGDGGRRVRGAPLRLRRGDARRALAADGAAFRAAFPELRGPLRAARRRPEPDRPRADGRRGRARRKRRAHRRRRPPATGRGERPRRGALPDGRRARGSGPDPGRRGVRRVGGRGRGRAARLDARHHGGLCQLRPARRRRDLAAGAGARGRAAGAGRARAHDLVDRAIGAHRRRAVPGRAIPSSARSSSRRACSRSRRCATCSPPSRPRGCRSRTSCSRP